MKTLMLVLLTSFLVFVSCDCPQVVEPSVTKSVEKPEPTLQYPYLQEFHPIPIDWSPVENKSIFIKILNQNLFNIIDEFFIVVAFSESSMMYYLGRPSKPTFNVLHINNGDIQNVYLFAIINHSAKPVTHW